MPLSGRTGPDPALRLCPCVVGELGWVAIGLLLDRWRAVRLGPQPTLAALGLPTTGLNGLGWRWIFNDPRADYGRDRCASPGSRCPSSTLPPWTCLVRGFSDVWKKRRPWVVGPVAAVPGCN